jgi:hypothetical protein
MVLVRPARSQRIRFAFIFIQQGASVMDHSLTTECILNAFSSQITEHGGTVSDTYDDGRRLFVRSILPHAGEASANDRLQGGVALKACHGDVWVHPYVFRLVCRNGAIVAQTLSSCLVSAVFDFQPETAIAEIEQAVAGCCDAGAFSNSLQQIRSARETEADLAINLLPLLTRLPRGGPAILTQIMQRFFEDKDESRFGLMNAVTSVARDTADPETRWNLEELGGGIAVAAPEAKPRTPARAERRMLALVS